MRLVYTENCREVYISLVKQRASMPNIPLSDSLTYRHIWLVTTRLITHLDVKNLKQK